MELFLCCFCFLMLHSLPLCRGGKNIYSEVLLVHGCSSRGVLSNRDVSVVHTCTPPHIHAHAHLHTFTHMHTSTPSCTCTPPHIHAHEHPPFTHMHSSTPSRTCTPPHIHAHAHLHTFTRSLLRCHKAIIVQLSHTRCHTWDITSLKVYVWDQAWCANSVLHWLDLMKSECIWWKAWINKQKKTLKWE